VGVDSPLVVCARSEIFEDGFNIIYRAWSRTLKDPTVEKGYRINLIQQKDTPTTSVGRSVSISKERSYTCTPPNLQCPEKMLIITEIKILLV